MSPCKIVSVALLASSILALLVAFGWFQSYNRGTFPQNEFVGAPLAPTDRGVSPAAYPSLYLPVQTKNPKVLSAGKLLVASRSLGDPHFVRTVILLVRYDDNGVVGLILNRRTEVPLSQVLDLKAAKKISDPVYLGGPVEMPAVFALFQSPAKVEGAEHIFGEVYMVSAKDLFEHTLSTRPDPRQFHVYLGYSGWSKEQLKKEVGLGAWFIFPGDVSTVFNADPDSLWPKMIGKTELEMADNRPANLDLEVANEISGTN